MAVLAVAALALAVGSLLVIGGVIFAPFLFGLFGLALVGVLSGVDERTVRQRDPQLSPTGWRDGSQAVHVPAALRRDVPAPRLHHDRERRVA